MPHANLIYLWMIYFRKMIRIFNIVFLISFILVSCNSKNKQDAFYFGGEIINPKDNFVVLMKQNEPIDTIYLNKDNFFLKKLTHLEPGMYSFHHGPEYQYVFFENQDSLMIRLNTNDFDGSLTFCGRGDEKNSFLIEMYLKNRALREDIYELFDLEHKDFVVALNKKFKQNQVFFKKYQQKIEWSADFDLYAQTSLNYSYYSQKEIYPMAHHVRTGHNILSELPNEYFEFRNKIDLNNEKLLNYSPFMYYVSHMLSNVSLDKLSPSISLENKTLEMSLIKLQHTDSIFKNSNSKNKILKHIAYSYLLEDQNIVNNTRFIDEFKKVSDDQNTLEELNIIGKNIQNLTVGNQMPETNLIDLEGNTHSTNSLFNKNTIVFFWSSRFKSHMHSSHKNALKYLNNHKNYQVVSVNIDEEDEPWKNALKEVDFGNIVCVRAKDFTSLKDQWVILKLQRTFILDEKGKIAYPFVNLFDADFEKKLKS